MLRGFSVDGILQQNPPKSGLLTEVSGRCVAIFGRVTPRASQGEIALYGALRVPGAALDRAATIQSIEAMCRP